MSTAIVYHFYTTQRNLNKEAGMEAGKETVDLKKRVIDPKDVKPSGDDVKPDPAGEKVQKENEPEKSVGKAASEPKKKKSKKESILDLSNDLTDGKINLDDAIKTARSLKDEE
jgi:hypothetical protein